MVLALAASTRPTSPRTPTSQRPGPPSTSSTPSEGPTSAGRPLAPTLRPWLEARVDSRQLQQQGRPTLEASARDCATTRTPHVQPLRPRSGKPTAPTRTACWKLAWPTSPPSPLGRATPEQVSLPPGPSSTLLTVGLPPMPPALPHSRASPKPPEVPETSTLPLNPLSVPPVLESTPSVLPLQVPTSMPRLPRRLTKEPLEQLPRLTLPLSVGTPEQELPVPRLPLHSPARQTPSSRLLHLSESALTLLLPPPPTSSMQSEALTSAPRPQRHTSRP